MTCLLYPGTTITRRSDASEADALDAGDCREETIYNGERCTVAKCGSDYLDLEFPQNSERLTRIRSLLMNNPDGAEAKAQLPDSVLFGSALSTHNAQGSPF